MDPSDFIAFLPQTCFVLSTLLMVYILFTYARQPAVRPEPSYAFSASTKVRRRGPTVLQFSARVPGNNVTPTVISTFEARRVEHLR